jgi:hypothetical protein
VPLLLDRDCLRRNICHFLCDLLELALDDVQMLGLLGWVRRRSRGSRIINKSDIGELGIFGRENYADVVSLVERLDPE